MQGDQRREKKRSRSIRQRYTSSSDKRKPNIQQRESEQELSIMRESLSYYPTWLGTFVV